MLLKAFNNSKLYILVLTTSFLAACGGGSDSPKKEITTDPEDSSYLPNNYEGSPATLSNFKIESFQNLKVDSDNIEGIWLYTESFDINYRDIGYHEINESRDFKGDFRALFKIDKVSENHYTATHFDRSEYADVTNLFLSEDSNEFYLYRGRTVFKGEMRDFSEVTGTLIPSDPTRHEVEVRASRVGMIKISNNTSNDPETMDEWGEFQFSSNGVSLSENLVGTQKIHLFYEARYQWKIIENGLVDGEDRSYRVGFASYYKTDEDSDNINPRVLQIGNNFQLQTEPAETEGWYFQYDYSNDHAIATPMAVHSDGVTIAGSYQSLPCSHNEESFNYFLDLEGDNIAPNISHEYTTEISEIWKLNDNFLVIKDNSCAELFTCSVNNEFAKDDNYYARLQGNDLRVKHHSRYSWYEVGNQNNTLYSTDTRLTTSYSIASEIPDYCSDDAVEITSITPLGPVIDNTTVPFTIDFIYRYSPAETGRIKIGYAETGSSSIIDVTDAKLIFSPETSSGSVTVDIAPQVIEDYSITIYVRLLRDPNITEGTPEEILSVDSKDFKVFSQED